MAGLPPEFLSCLRQSIAGDVRDDFVTRLLYSTDASIYQAEPLGVVFPRSLDDLTACVNLAAEYGIAVIARGAGSGLAGQAIGSGLILDTSRYLKQIIAIRPEEKTARVEPGVNLTLLNRAAARYGLVFGPDPASADRATVGGSIANNATGAHSIQYGMAADHLISAEVVLGDGSLATFEPVSLEEARRRARSTAIHGEPLSAESALYQTALAIRQSSAQVIRAGWPKVWRRASGYNLNYLLPWSPVAPPQWYSEQGYPPVPANSMNLATLFAGSEGTLGVIRQMTLRLVSKPAHTVVGVLSFASIAAACDAVVELLEMRPSAIELIPGDLIHLARSIPAYARQLSFVQGDPAALLAVEFAGDSSDSLKDLARQLGDRALIAESPAEQKQIWEVRKVGLGIFNSRPGDAKPLSFIEDLVVPVEHLGRFVREMEHIVAEHGTSANYYAHASAGCLHIRPLINLKDIGNIVAMRSIAEQAVALTLSLNGAPSGEHGDGWARSEWTERTFGADIVQLFRNIKQAADPHGILNPGKILDAPAMDANLRYGSVYHTHGWQTAMDFSDKGGLVGAIEMCNGAGVCRKSEGVMCPSFQATQDEMHSTRGRSNLLRAMISDKFSSAATAEQSVYTALDLCLACKGCKSECPSLVDVAKLKYEFFDHYYRTHSRRLRDYLFGYIGRLAPLAGAFAPFVNAFLAMKPVRKLNERVFGLAARRGFPRFTPLVHSWKVARQSSYAQPEVLFLTDTFSRYFHTETEIAARSLLETLGLHVRVIPVIGAGRTLISKGFLDAARKHAEQLLVAIDQLDPAGCLPVVGVEPSEILTLRDEFIDFFPDDVRVKSLKQRTWMIDEFLLRPDRNGRSRMECLVQARGVKSGQVLLHGHCYQKAQPPAEDGYPAGVPATVKMLEAAGYKVEVVDSGCCGMAGAFGYEKEHYAVSMQVGELALFPRIRDAEAGVLVAAAGTSCRSQIEDGVGKKASHPICLV